MKNAFLQRAIMLKKNSKNRKRWQGFVRTMAMVVVFCTTYALILPAITMEADPVCGHEAHVHTEACYEQVTVTSLQCQLEEGAVVVHQHAEGCFDSRNELICTLPEIFEHTHDETCVAKAEQPSCAFVHVHNESCTVTEQVLTCETAEAEAHTHSESCVVMEKSLTCTLEESDTHTHEDACYTQTEVPCSIPETEGHTHGEGCYTQQEVPCTLTAEEGHVHEDSCYETLQVCTRDEIRLHTHEDACRGADGALICGKPLVIAHQHTESCFVTAEQPEMVLICTMEEHTHTDDCYPAEEEEATGAYLCGMGVHQHVETCFDEAGTLTCTIPEHAHEAACVVADLDLNADVEAAAQWEAAAAIARTGNWAQDLVAVANTQIGYTESVKNVVLQGDQLKGYTLYGAKSGNPYGDWGAAFVSFCLDRAGVQDVPRGSDAADWMQAAQNRQMFVAADALAPAGGDLIFLDVNRNDVADQVAIAVRSAGEGLWQMIVGDAEQGCVTTVTYALTGDTVLGGCPLPKNPMAEELLDEAGKAAAMLAELPTAEEASSHMTALNEVLDRETFDTYVNDLNTRLAQFRALYATLDEEQKALTGDITGLDALETLLAEYVWQQLPALTADSAAVSALTALDLTSDTVVNQQTALLPFQVETVSYTEESFSEGRLRMEFVLPLGPEQAEFDLTAMPWLDEASVTTRTVQEGETEAVHQVLTGYWHVQAAVMTGAVIPGSYTESAAVKVVNMAHNDQIVLSISAALEHGTWDGICPTHQIEEKLTVRTPILRVMAPADAQTQQDTYNSLLLECEILAAMEISNEERTTAADALWQKVSEKYLTGYLTEEAFSDLSARTSTMQYGNLDTVAEPCLGSNWMILRDSGWFEEFSDTVSISASYQAPVVNGVLAPTPFALGSTTSGVQVVQPGGDAISQENAVYVSKTIAGTGIENVFDITLDVITQDIVTEVYKEPDMAVVIVMDISQTMNSDFGGSTRYKAAMTAAEGFLKQFAANNLGASNVGFVAFNTSAHEIFPMSPCSTTAQVNALISDMKADTGKIINASNYASAHSRFTNIEAGLKRGYDLLNSVDNKNKYIIFLSDGFPTTYISSGYSGYDPYDSSGSRFYDSVELYNGKKRPCSAGTSYSDEAAIRARKQASAIKDQGVKIFSVGVDIGGQTIQKYVNDFKGKDFSVVDRRSTDYEIGSATSTSAYKTWLGNKIGSGFDNYYFDSTDTAGLTSAFNSIFTTIKELNAQSSHLDWVATDPMPGMGVHEVEDIEFIGFFDKDNNLVDTDLVGESKMGWNYENTATFDEATQTIKWDLKKSRYVSTAVGSATNYECQLTYRVRLKNENSGFVEFGDYVTNDVTDLTYRIIDKSGNRVTVSEQRKVAFPIPQVEGYLGELQFTKIDSYGDPVEGAEFTLTHDTASCGYCRGDGKSRVAVPNMTATSDASGLVKFTRIPSGHTYALTETHVPDGYMNNANTYQVKVAYDQVTVTVKDKDGQDVTWDQTIENYTSYRLPETGGSGTSFLTIGGLLMLAAAFVYTVILAERKYRRGGRESEK